MKRKVKMEKVVIFVDTETILEKELIEEEEEKRYADDE